MIAVLLEIRKMEPDSLSSVPSSTGSAGKTQGHLQQSLKKGGTEALQSCRFFR